MEGDEEEFTSLKSTHKALPKEAESQMGQTHETTEVSWVYFSTNLSTY